MKQGALPSQHIRKLIEDGHVVNGNIDQVEPSSLDLTLGDTIYRLPSIFLPRPNERIEDLAKSVGAEPHSFEYPLEMRTPYLIKLKEDLALPEDVYAYANPKSSTGRVGLHVSMLADGVSRFDAAGRRGYKGTLWAIVRPEAFRVKLNPGDALLQLRFFYSDTRFHQKELETFFEEHTPLYLNNNPLNIDDIKVMDRDGGLILTADLRNELVGWRSEGSAQALDFSKRDFYDPNDFFQPIYKSKNGTVSFRRGDFYILYTRERISVPPDYAAEMAPVDVRSGEFRSHYAGFIDPGFGYGPKGDVKGTPMVLEVRTFEDNLILRDNQPVGKVIFERVSETPDKVYGGSGSHYLTQSGPRLSKHFKEV